MLALLNRSRSFRGGAGHAGDSKAHGPNAPVAAEPGHVSGPTLQNSTVLGLVENADIPSMSFPNGRNPYLDRPLPPPPPPKTASAMPARPSTSSGPNAGKGTARPFFDKRISRDDMFLNPYSTKSNFDRRMSRDDMDLGRHTSRGFHIPVRGHPPTPEASPRYDGLPIASIPVRMATPESLTSGEIQIGMALGSPSNPPSTMAPTWQPQIPYAAQASSSSDTVVTSETTLQRQKTGRRKLFGIFGGGRKHQELTKAHHEAAASNATLSTATSISQSSVDRPPTRSNTFADKKAQRYQPIITRTNTEPVAPSPVKESRPLRPFLRSKASEPVIRQKKDASQETLRPPLPINTSPYLDIEIPDVKMERYSVMFGSLLHPQQQPASSLLARRQATLDKLRTINDKIIQEEEIKERARGQRRATSPQPSKSPAFTLFPPTPSAKKNDSPTTAPGKLSPRLRSNTSPAMLPSPVKTTFDHDPMRADRSKGNFLKVDPLRGNPTMMAGQGRNQRDYAAPTPILFDQSQSSLILDSPTEMEAPQDSRMPQQPFKPSIPEPQWQMVSPPSSAANSTISSSASSLRKRSPSSVSSVQTHVTKPSIDETDSALKSAVEISIARQISISRQQRQLLRPLQTNVQQTRAGRVSPSPNSATAKASPVKKLGKNEKLQETRFATPTLIHPEETLDSQLMQHRKSERVILEAA